MWVAYFCTFLMGACSTVVGGVRGARNAVCGEYLRPYPAPNTQLSNPKSYEMTCMKVHLAVATELPGFLRDQAQPKQWRVGHCASGDVANTPACARSRVTDPSELPAISGQRLAHARTARMVMPEPNVQFMSALLCRAAPHPLTHTQPAAGSAARRRPRSSTLPRHRRRSRRWPGSATGPS